MNVHKHKRWCQGGMHGDGDGPPRCYSWEFIRWNRRIGSEFGHNTKTHWDEKSQQQSTKFGRADWLTEKPSTGGRWWMTGQWTVTRLCKLTRWLWHCPVLSWASEFANKYQADPQMQFRRGHCVVHGIVNNFPPKVRIVRNRLWRKPKNRQQNV